MIRTPWPQRSAARERAATHAGKVGDTRDAPASTKCSSRTSCDGHGQNSALTRRDPQS